MNRWKILIQKPLKYIANRSAFAIRTDAVARKERLVLAQGKQLANWTCSLKKIAQLEDAEFRIFSQFGDDGIIQYIISHISNLPNTFIEFGVENYVESNTRFLLMNNNWSGFIMDSSQDHINSVISSYYYWQHDIVAKAAFITAENIDDLLSERQFSDVGILHIDIDGNDYWVWKAIDCVRPCVVIAEYNSIFGSDRLISIPYAPDFQRTRAHYSNLYYGASLAALSYLASEKGYTLIGSNNAGNNAYFLRSNLLNEFFRPLSCEQAYRQSKFREGRDESGKLTFLAGDDRLNVIMGMPVVNVKTNAIEIL
jgi:hypothetical protein